MKTDLAGTNSNQKRAKTKDNKLFMSLLLARHSLRMRFAKKHSTVRLLVSCEGSELRKDFYTDKIDCLKGSLTYLHSVSGRLAWTRCQNRIRPNLTMECQEKGVSSNLCTARRQAFIVSH